MLQIHFQLLFVMFVVMIDFYLVRKGSIGNVHACYLHGTDSGECTTQSLDTGWLSENMPYCQIPMLVIPNTLFPVCVPKTQVSSSNNPRTLIETFLIVFFFCTVAVVPTVVVVCYALIL